MTSIKSCKKGIREVTSVQILKLWEKVSEEQKDQIIIKLIRSCNKGRKIAQSGMSSFPHYMRDEEPLRFVTPRVRPLSEVRGLDVPPGMNPEDVATDYPPPCTKA